MGELGDYAHSPRCPVTYTVSMKSDFPVITTKSKTAIANVHMTKTAKHEIRLRLKWETFDELDVNAGLYRRFIRRPNNGIWASQIIGLSHL